MNIVLSGFAMYQMGIFAGQVGHIFDWANTERSGVFQKSAKKSKLDNGRLHRKGSFNWK